MIDVQRLPSGYLHIRGRGPCNWTQPPGTGPLDEKTLRAHAFPEASDEFIREAAAVLRACGIAAESETRKR